MKSPEAQQSAAQMQAVMQNPAFLAKMQELQQDPELEEFWKGLQQGGMPAMMKAMNDPMLIAKLSGMLLPEELFLKQQQEIYKRLISLDCHY